MLLVLSETKIFSQATVKYCEVYGQVVYLHYSEMVCEIWTLQYQYQVQELV